jgi:N-acetyl-anhydromuramyl-L-alanine amidase AmpD
MQGYLTACYNLFNTPANDKSSHYGIGKNGQVEQYVSEADAAWGSGIWNKPVLSNRFLADAFNDQPPTNSNQILIHIELEDFPGGEGPAMPGVQYAALLALVRSIFARHKWPVNDSQRYIRHSDVDSVTRATDPGVYLNLPQLRADMQAKPPVDLAPELARLYALSASLAQLAADVKAKVGA